MKKDRLGRDLEVDDFVVFLNTSGYKELELGKVLGFTAKKIKVGYGKEFEWTLTTDAYRMCKVPPEDVMMYLIKS